MKTQLCPLCGLLYPDAGGLWIGCDGCDAWFDIKCTEDSVITVGNIVSFSHVCLCL